MATRREQLQCFDLSQNYYSNIIYSNVSLTYDYRKERPYRLLMKPGVSAVSMLFGMSGVRNAKKIILELNHCGTTSNGLIDIMVNDRCFSRQIKTPRDDFKKEQYAMDIHLFKPENNKIVVTLNNQSPGVYWLSDVRILVETQINKAEDDIEATARVYLVNMRKYITEEEKMIKNLLEIADSLDELEKATNEAQTRGLATKIAGGLLMIGALALEVLSEGIATPIAAEMTTAGLVLWVRGNVTDISSQIIHKVMEEGRGKEAQDIYNAGKQLRETMDMTRRNLTSQMQPFIHRYQQQYPVLAQATLDEIVGFRLLLTSTGYTQLTDSASKFCPGIAEMFSELASAVSIAGLALLGIDVALSFVELMKEIAEISKGSPSQMARNIRNMGTNMQKHLDIAKHFMGETLTCLLTQLKEELQHNNLYVVAKIIKQMTIFDGIQAQQGIIRMAFLNNFNEFKKELTRVQLDNLAKNEIKIVIIMQYKL